MCIYIWEKNENVASPPSYQKVQNLNCGLFDLRRWPPPFGLFPLFGTFFVLNAPLIRGRKIIDMTIQNLLFVKPIDLNWYVILTVSISISSELAKLSLHHLHFACCNTSSWFHWAPSQLHFSFGQNCPSPRSRRTKGKIWWIQQNYLNGHCSTSRFQTLKLHLCVNE